MAVASTGLSDEQKQEWTKRCQDEPGFQAALVVETYVAVKTLQSIAEAVAAQMGPAMGMLGKLGMGGNAKEV